MDGEVERESRKKKRVSLPVWSSAQSAPLRLEEWGRWERKEKKEKKKNRASWVLVVRKKLDSLAVVYRIFLPSAEKRKRKPKSNPRTRTRTRNQKPETQKPFLSLSFQKRVYISCWNMGRIKVFSNPHVPFSLLNCPLSDDALWWWI